MRPRRIGREVRHGPVRLLIRAHIAQVFLQKAFEIHQPERRARKTCASPVQPNRSPRRGQSVGTSMKFDRCDQIGFNTGQLTAGTLQVNPPESSGNEDIGTDSILVTVASPVTVTVTRAWR